MSDFYPVAEVVDDSGSVYLRFFVPVRWLWLAKAKIYLFKLLKERGGQRVVSRIVDKEQAEFLFVSYAEWRLRRQIDTATPEAA